MVAAQSTWRMAKRSNASCLAVYLMAKLSHNEDERDGFGGVGPQSGSVKAREETVGGKALSQEVVGQFSRLWKVIHPFVDLDVYPTGIVGKIMEIVLLDDFVRYKQDMDFMYSGQLRGVFR